VSYDPAGSIDAFLKKRGSPLAGYGNVFVAAGKKYGVDPRLVVSISGIESSFGQHIPQGTFNAWGWGPGRPFASWNEGIATVTRGLAEKYIAQGLVTPDQIVSKYAPGSAGNDESNWAKVVNGFMSDLGAPLSASATKTASRSSSGSYPKPPSTAGVQGALLGELGRIAQRGHASPLEMMQDVLQGRLADIEQDRINALSQGTVDDDSSSSSSDNTGSKRFAANGNPVPANMLTSIGAAHPTAGLPGFPAKDYMAPAGAPAVAPVAGTVIRFSGHDPASGPTSGVHGPFGWSLYIRGADGHTYYLTHMGSRSVKVGQRVKAGQQIGTVGDYAKWGGADHIHMGVS